MSKVLTKFEVIELTKFRKKSTGKVFLSPVIGGTEENKNFWKYTPGGGIDLIIDNPEAFKQFEEMGEFYVTFERVD